MPPPMDGRTCVVTGASSGIGLETARGLVRLGAIVVLACRDEGRANAAKESIEADTPNAHLEVRDLDLARLASVRRFAAEVLAAHPKIDVLVNNAGMYVAKRRVTDDGFESTFQTNHLGHFLLTQLLFDCIKGSAPSRIVNVASEANHGARIDLDDLNLERRWSGFRAYCNSKLMNILHGFELARRLEGTSVTANAMHPGGVRTNFARHGAGWMGVGFRLASPFLIPAERGADTVVWLASSPDVERVSGGYFYKRRRIDPHPIARDPDLARRLWSISEALVSP